MAIRKKPKNAKAMHRLAFKKPNAVNYDEIFIVHGMRRDYIMVPRHWSQDYIDTLKLMGFRGPHNMTIDEFTEAIDRGSGLPPTAEQKAIYERYAAGVQDVDNYKRQFGITP